VRSAHPRVAYTTLFRSKEIPGVSKYVSIDGGMSDHLRTPLYDAQYDVIPVNRTNGGNAETNVVGKLCESGDIIGKHLTIPADLKRGDLLRSEEHTSELQS